MLMPNCLFRVGGAAMLLSNRRRDAFRAKYELLHTVGGLWGHMPSLQRLHVPCPRQPARCTMYMSSPLWHEHQRSTHV